ncbi:NAC domain-containing protein 67-like [Olea europaea var. sylvestris]|uniref:NAC domain-containing protein 67-like n=1 Tax=Olea europaea var. sylvestris TaxID=158386 RepID=UPI000C1D0A14|nr:NAC domain-containing protein 67-like [Olea europaea var. sylvestris]
MALHFFFTLRNRKYKHGMRPNRAAEGGYWKTTGADKTIKHNGEEIGLRKALVFYKGKPPHCEKTSWIMHEFRLKNAPIRSRTSDDDMKACLAVLLRCLYSRHVWESVAATEDTEVVNFEWLTSILSTIPL